MPINFNIPCGKDHIEKCEKSRALKALSERMQTLQIANDYLILWSEAEDGAGRKEAWMSYRREMRRAMAYSLTLEGAHAAIIHQASASPAMGGGYVLLYVIVYWWMMRR
jgi:hypothetical protein